MADSGLDVAELPLVGEWNVTIRKEGLPRKQLPGSDFVNQYLSSITTLQAGTGAVARTIQDRTTDWVSIRDFSNDAAGITAALAAHPGAMVPAGTYSTMTARTVGSGKLLELMPGAVVTSIGAGSWALAAGGSVISKTEGLAGNVHYWGRKLSGVIASGAGPFAGYSPSAYHWDILSDDADVGADFLDGFRVRHLFGGSSVKGGREALTGALWHTAATNSVNANRNYVAVQGKTYSQAGDGGTNTGAGAKGQYFGGGFAAYADAAATNLLHLTGAEFNTFMASGATARYTDGLSVAGCNTGHGADTDAGIAITGMNAVGSYGPHDGWGAGVLFTDRSGAAPLSTSATVIGSFWTAGGTKTVANGVDLQGFTFTGHAFVSNGFGVDPDGDTIAKSLTLATELAVTEGGTGGSTPAAARANLGVAWSLIVDSGALGSVASFIQDGIPATYNFLRITYSLRPATDGAALAMLLRKASGTDIVLYDRGLTYATGSTPGGLNQLGLTTLPISSTTENTSPQGIVAGEIIINNIQSSDHKGGTWTCSTFTNAGELLPISGAFKCNDTAAITGVKFQFSPGNIAAGWILIQGA